MNNSRALLASSECIFYLCLFANIAEPTTKAIWPLSFSLRGSRPRQYRELLPMYLYQPNEILQKVKRTKPLHQSDCSIRCYQTTEINNFNKEKIPLGIGPVRRGPDPLGFTEPEHKIAPSFWFTRQAKLG